MALLRVTAALLLVCAARLGAQTKASEAQVKAVFLFNFAQFVDWPPEAVPDSQAPLVIGILGSDPFGDFLDATVRGEHRGARPFAVRWNQWFTPSPLWIAAGLTVPQSRAQRTMRSFGDCEI